MPKYVHKLGLEFSDWFTHLSKTLLFPIKIASLLVTRNATSK